MKNNGVLTQRDIDVLNSNDLSWASKGLFLWLTQGFHGQRELRKAFILQHSGAGFGTTTSAMRELEAKKLLKRITKRDENAKYIGHFWGI